MRLRRSIIFPLLAAILLSSGATNPAAAAAAAAPAPDFASEIRPILEQSCFGCHGPDKAKGGLRLHTAEFLRVGGDGGAAVVPGDPDASLLWRAVAGLEADMFMPAEGDPLTPEQVALLRRWIESGAPWAEDPDASAGGSGGEGSSHWAYQPIRRPFVPRVKNESEVRNPVDAFILRTLEERGIDPSPEADRATLVRRLHLDLTGLPPSAEEATRLLESDDPFLYAGLTRRLLASPHFGERQARHWLDLARYADSDGYEKDNVRPNAWRYRHWLIDAINRDMPYDQFVIEQLAGDLLPGATPEQTAATGFHRNTLTNREGGVDPEEDRVKQTVDRTNTTGEVFLGLTLGCAECHSHKYDAISHREYFSLYAFFNSAVERDQPAPLAEDWLTHRAALAAWETAGQELGKEIDELRRSIPARAAAWESALTDREVRWKIVRTESLSVDPPRESSMMIDGSIRVAPGEGANTEYAFRFRTGIKSLTALRLELLPPAEGDPLPEIEITEVKVTAAAADASSSEKLVFTSVRATTEAKDRPVANLADNQGKTSWKPGPGFDGNAKIELRSGYPVADAAAKTFELSVRHKGPGALPRFRVSATSAPPGLLDASEEILTILASEARVTDARDKLHDFYERNIDPDMTRLLARRAEHARLKPAPPETLAPALGANPEPPATRIHLRGDFLRPGDEVTPATPAVLPPLVARGDVPDRLDLARWIASPGNPLTARVEVNRIWERLFGVGLVHTPGDFGVQGTPPTHPELLDWLAAEFMESGWSRKHLYHLITDSAAYRRSSAHRPALADIDPGNHLLYRQNRYRLPAEIIRDISLSAAGLLDPRVGGPGIRPPLPDGVADLGYARSVRWQTSEGPDRFRRGLYIFFQRTVPYPMLMAFDCPDSNVSNARRQRSNTPIQSLTLMNDPVFTECAAALATRIVREGGGDDASRTDFAFRTTLGRPPGPEETAAIGRLLAEAAREYADDPAASKSVAGLLSPDAVARIGAVPDASAAEMAAWTAAARVLLNLDEFMSRD